MAKRNRATAVSYDFLGNPINVPQDSNQYFGAPAQEFQPISLDVGNHQTVTQGLNTGSNYYGPIGPMPDYQTAPEQQPPSYSFNPDGSILMNTDYINTYLNSGKRGFDAYGTYDRNTNRRYASEGMYGQRDGLDDFSMFEDGGSLSPGKAGKIRGKKLTDKQRKLFGAISNQADNGMQFNNPFTDDRQFNYGSSPDYLRYANQGTNQTIQPIETMQPQMLPVDYTKPVGQPMQNRPSDTGGSGGGSYGSAASGIQSGVEAVGGLFSGINDLKNQIIVGGGALINGMLKDQHNIRRKTPLMADQTLAYQPQYNNMMKDGGKVDKNPKEGPNQLQEVVIYDRQDPRMKAYKDSLSLYNTAQQIMKDKKYGDPGHHMFDKVQDKSDYTRPEDWSFNYGVPDNEKLANRLAATQKRTGIQPVGYYAIEGQFPYFKKPTMPVSLANIEKLPTTGLQQDYRVPAPDPLEWDSPSNKGIFPLYGDDKNLIGTYDPNVNGNTVFYPNSNFRPGNEGESRGLPPDYKTYSPFGMPTNIRRSKKEMGGSLSQGSVVNNAYQPGEEVDLTPEEVENLRRAGYQFEVIK